MATALSAGEVAKRTMLDRFERFLTARISESDIPFLGLHDAVFTQNMSDYVGRVAREHRSVDAYIQYLKHWPALFSIYLTRQVMRGFGVEAHFAVWPAIEETLGVAELSGHERERLWTGFRSACIKLGLEVSSRHSGMHFMVEEFLRHAGVPLRFVRTLAERMLQFSRDSGIPDDNDPDAVRVWQDAFIDRLVAPFSRTARKALELDQGGYYVRLFTQNLAAPKHSADVQSDVEAQMLEALQGVDERTRNTHRPIAIPQLVLRDSEVGVQLPAGEDRYWVVESEERSATYPGSVEARFVALSESLPRRVVVNERCTGLTRTYQLWPEGRNNEFLVFEASTGRFVCAARLGSLDAPPEVPLPPGDHNLLLRFSPDGLTSPADCVSEEPALYRARISLKPAERLELRRGPAVVTLKADAQPLLIWSGESVISNEGREVFASSDLHLLLVVPDEMLVDGNGAFTLRVDPGMLGASCDVAVNVDATGEASTDIGELARVRGWRPALSRLLVELRRANQVRALVRTAALIWNGLDRVRHRASFLCTALPENLDRELSTNVRLAADQKAVTYHDDSQRFFRMAFPQRSGSNLILSWSVPGVFLYLEETGENGMVSERPLRLGSTVVAGALTRQQLRIYGSEPALLRVGQWERMVDFDRLGSVRLPLAGLAEYLSPGTDTLYYVDREGRGAEVGLVSLVHPHESWDFRVTQHHNLAKVEFSTGQEVQAFRLLAHSVLADDRFEIEAIPNQPEATRSSIGSVRAFQGSVTSGEHRYSIYLPLENWPQGAWRVDLEANISGNWGLLCNSRQDRYALGFLFDAKGTPARCDALIPTIAGSEIEQQLKVFERVHRCLLECYAQESWSSLRWLNDIWTHLALRFETQKEAVARRLLELAALKSAESASASWIPLASLFARFPWLLALDRDRYAGVDGRQGRLVEVLGLTAEFASSPQTRCKVDFHPAALLAFRNAQQIEKTNAAPRGFQLTRYQGALAACDIPEKRYLLYREDWHPGRGDYLGPLHYRYGVTVLGARYDQSLAGNEERRGNALRISRFVRQHFRRLDAHGLPAHLRPASGEIVLEALDKTPENEPDDTAQRRENLLDIERLTALFAQICRWEARAPGVLSEFLHWLPGEPKDNEGAIGFVLHVGEELMAFYLLLWELALTADHDLGGT